MNQGGKSEMEETTFMADPMRLMIATLAAMYFLGIRRGFTGAQLKNIGSLTQTGRYDTSCYCQWRCDQMDASGFRSWKYYWSGS